MSLFYSVPQLLLTLIGLNFLSAPVLANNIATNNEKETPVVFDWKSNWDVKSQQDVRTFENYNDSGVDVSITYSKNQSWQKTKQHNGLNLLEKGNKSNALNDPTESWLYDGTLKLTNNIQDKGSDPSWMTINFSSPVNLSEFWIGNIDIFHMRGQDHVQVRAFDKDGKRIDPSKIGNYQAFYNQVCSDKGNQPQSKCDSVKIDNPNVLKISSQNNTSMISATGLSNGQSGRVFFDYNNVSRVEIIFITTMYSTTTYESGANRAFEPSYLTISPLKFTSVEKQEKEVVFYPD